MASVATDFRSADPSPLYFLLQTQEARQPSGVGSRTGPNNLLDHVAAQFDAVISELDTDLEGAYFDSEGRLTVETSGYQVRATPSGPDAISAQGSLVSQLELLSLWPGQSDVRLQGSFSYQGLPLVSDLLASTHLTSVWVVLADPPPGFDLVRHQILDVDFDGSVWSGTLGGTDRFQISVDVEDFLVVSTYLDAPVSGLARFALEIGPGLYEGIVLEYGAPDGSTIDEVWIQVDPALSMDAVDRSAYLADLLAGDDQVSMSGPGAGFIATYAGDDTILLGPGSDWISGGPGFDIALQAEPRAAYTVQKSGDAFTFTHRLDEFDVDTLVGCELVWFEDLSIGLVRPARAAAPAYDTDASFLFDPVYYLLANDDVAALYTVDDALSHYLSSGAAQGRAPNGWFEPDFYANRWDDLRVLELDDATLFMHYNLYGVWEGRSAAPEFDAFDGGRYLTDNPDVAEYVDAHLPDFLGSRSNGAIAHYVIYGADEQRPAHDTAGTPIDLGYVL